MTSLNELLNWVVSQPKMVRQAIYGFVFGVFMALLVTIFYWLIQRSSIAGINFIIVCFCTAAWATYFGSQQNE